ncbi:MAG: TM2 domain-containing protein [Spirochaetia bacterium]
MYSIGVAYLLWLISGFGVLGFHRFYLGKVGTGLIYLLTGGLFGIGSIYDLITLPIQVREANIRVEYHQALWNRSIRDVGGSSTAQRSDARSGVSGRKEGIEKVILRTAKRNGGLATPPEVALEGDYSLDEVKKALDTLVDKGYAELRVNRNGGMAYFFPEFSQNGAHPDLEDF